MRTLIVAAGLALALAACAPVHDVATIDYNGNFGGPVVADRVPPISTRYQNLCEGPVERWRYGYYRAYGDCPPAPAVVRARY